MAGRGRGYASISQNSSLRKPGEDTLKKYTANTDSASNEFLPPVMKPADAANLNISSNNGQHFASASKVYPTAVDAANSNNGCNNGQQFASASKVYPLQPSGNHIFDKICDKISKVNFSDPQDDLAGCLEEVRILCNTKDNLEKWVDIMFNFGLKSWKNAHAVALFSESIADLAVDQTKFRNLLLNKLKNLYDNRNASYRKSLDCFVVEAYLACELFNHLQIKGTCIEILVKPILDYMEMLLNGASQQEIEVLLEQLPNSYKSIAEKDPRGLEILFIAMRLQILSDKIAIPVKSMLLELLELSLTNFVPLKPKVRHFYESNHRTTFKKCT